MNVFAYLNKVLGKMGRLLHENHVNWLKTVWLNFRAVPFRQAVRLPIYVYSGTQIIDLSGVFLFEEPVSKGMVRIGKKWDRSNGKTRIVNRGKVKLGKNVLICKGTNIIVNPEGTLCIGNNIDIRENVEIFTTYRIQIGDNTCIVNHTQIMDSDFHYMIDVENRHVSPIKSEIVIGKNNWIGAYTVIKKGTRTPDNITIASAYSVLSKDYTNVFPENSVLGGIPARVLSTGKRRIFNMKNQAMVFYHINGSKTDFVLDPEIDLDVFCEY